MKHLILFLLLFVAIAPAQAETPALPSTNRLPGVDLTEGISQITGTAISPLWGVCAFGWWRWSHTSPELREQLPLICQPILWGTGLALLVLCFIKDVLGTAAPPFLKKPLDMIELFENKASALVASTALLPFLTAQMSQHLTETTAAAPVALPHLAMLPFASASFAMQLLMLPVALLAFGAVWITFHAVHVLISLCPFGFVDSALKLGKAALLSLLMLCSWLSPWLGAALSIVIVLVALFLAPKAFRFTVFGTLIAWDVLFSWLAKPRITPQAPHAFLACKTAGVPPRTYGHVFRAADGSLAFHYRPWLLLPPRTVRIAHDDLFLERGVVYPSLKSENSNSSSPLVHLLPRYRTEVEILAQQLRIRDIRECALKRGFQAVRAWISDTLQLGWQKLQQGAIR